MKKLLLIAGAALFIEACSYKPKTKTLYRIDILTRGAREGGGTFYHDCEKVNNNTYKSIRGEDTIYIQIWEQDEEDSVLTILEPSYNVSSTNYSAKGNIYFGDPGKLYTWREGKEYSSTATDGGATHKWTTVTSDSTLYTFDSIPHLTFGEWNGYPKGWGAYFFANKGVNYIRFKPDINSDEDYFMINVDSLVSKINAGLMFSDTTQYARDTNVFKMKYAQPVRY